MLDSIALTINDNDAYKFVGIKIATTIEVLSRRDVKS